MKRLPLVVALAAGCTGAVLTRVRPEISARVDGIPYSEAALGARDSSLKLFGEIRRVVPIGVEVTLSPRNPWMHPSTGFALDDRVLEVVTRVLGEHGITVVPRAELLEDPVYKRYDRTRPIGRRLHAALGILERPPGFALVAREEGVAEALVQSVLGGGPAVPEGAKEGFGTTFDAAAKTAKDAPPAPPPAVDPGAVDDAEARARLEKAAEAQRRVAPPSSPAERIQRTLAYLPPSIASRPDRAHVLALRPAEFVGSEADDGFVAQVLGSTKSDAAMLISVCLAVDPKQNTVGLCGPTTVLFYGPGGKALMTPLPIVRPQPEPTADELYFDPPAAPDLVAPQEHAFAGPELAALRDAAQTWRITFRTAYDAVRAAKKQEGDPEGQRAWTEARPAVLAAAWRPAPEQLAPFDRVVEQLMRSILKQLGRTPKAS